mgnify:CR=1 FL=1
MQKLFTIRSSMSKFFFTLLIISFSFAIQIPLQVEDNWESLQSDRVIIEWQYYDGFPFCIASKNISATMKEITNLLEDKENYYKVFDRIEFSKLITPEIVHIKLDMPFPFSGRDYIVIYSKNEIDDNFYYRFEATSQIQIPLDRDYVRLKNAAGGWILKPIDENRTQLTYIWNGELLGDFPDWALSRAWVEQGNEVITWIENALE